MPREGLWTGRPPTAFYRSLASLLKLPFRPLPDPLLMRALRYAARGDIRQVVRIEGELTRPDDLYNPSLPIPDDRLLTEILQRAEFVFGELYLDGQSAGGRLIRGLEDFVTDAGFASKADRLGPADATKVR